MNPLTFSTDYPFTSAGDPDTRDGTWGTCAEDDGKLVFQNVPDGQRVRITRVYGNMTAWVRGDSPAGTKSGALLALQNTGTKANPDVTLSAMGCMLYIQLATGQNEAAVQFDVDVTNSGLLLDDHSLVVKRAIYLNDTGLPIHMEATLIGEFVYEPAS